MEKAAALSAGADTAWVEIKQRMETGLTGETEPELKKLLADALAKVEKKDGQLAEALARVKVVEAAQYHQAAK